MAVIYPVGATSQSLNVQIVDDSGLPVEGLEAATWPAVSLSRAGAFADVSLDLVDLAAIDSAWTVGGVFERGGGYYRLDVPNTIFAAESFWSIRGEAADKRLLAKQVQVGLAATGSPGGGDNLVTITVEDVDGEPLQNASVSAYLNGLLAGTGKSNVGGIVTLNLNDNTYSIRITLGSHQFAGATLVVSGDTSATYTLTRLSITPSEPGRVTGFYTCLVHGVATAGIEVKATVHSINPAVIGLAEIGTAQTATSDANGIAEFPEMIPGVTYRIQRGAASTGVFASIPIDVNLDQPYELRPSVIGSP